MASVKEIQDQINNNTFDPSKLNARQRKAIDEAIRRGLITGPSMNELQSERAGAAKDVATIDAAVKNPIGVKLQQQGSSLDGRSEAVRSEEHTSELQSRLHLVCRLLLEKKKNKKNK